MGTALDMVVRVAGWALVAAAVATGVYWGVVAWHVLRTVRRVPTCRDGLRLARAEALKRGGPSVCVVAPAHNEEACIGDLARSLLAQDYPVLRVVFALDRCTDGTAAVVRREAAAAGRGEVGAGAGGVEIVEIDHCPPDRAGKVNAVMEGVARSAAARDAELLLFVDADTDLEPACIRASVALLLERGDGFQSLLSTLSRGRWFERVVQPAAGMELLRQYPLVRASARRGRRAFANGQYMLFTRAAYDAVGGHARVTHALLEDVELARLVERAGVPAGLHLADGMVRCRMYDSWPAFRQGWKRIYGESANRRIRRLRTVARRVRTVGAVLPGLAALGVLMGAWRWWAASDPGMLAACAAGLGVHLAVLAACYRLGGSRVADAPAYAVGAWLVGGILREAASDLERRVPTRWAGREYVREPR